MPPVRSIEKGKKVQIGNKKGSPAGRRESLLLSFKMLCFPLTVQDRQNGPKVAAFGGRGLFCQRMMRQRTSKAITPSRTSETDRMMPVFWLPVRPSRTAFRART